MQHKTEFVATDTRPLDFLNNAKGKNVIVDMGDLAISGILRSFDIHVNITLENATLYMGNEVKEQLKQVFIRGDRIRLISPGVKQ